MHQMEGREAERRAAFVFAQHIWHQAVGLGWHQGIEVMLEGARSPTDPIDAAWR
jgi:hypothetical protein